MSDWITWHAPYTGWLVTLLLAVLGTTLAIVGLRRRPNRTETGHCARCGYDLRGSPGERCSECGGRVGDAAPPLPRRWRWVFVGIVLAIGLPVAVFAKRVNEYGLEYYGYYGPLYWVLPDPVEEELVHGRYLIRISGDRYPYAYLPKKLVIRHDGRRIFYKESYHFSLGMSESNLPLGPIVDLDGDGHDELLVQETPGGAGNHAVSIILCLKDGTPEPRPVVWPNGLVLTGSQTDGRGRLLLRARVEFYFNAHGHGIYQQVILRYAAGRLEFQPDAMRKEYGTLEKEVARQIERVRQLPGIEKHISPFDEFWLNEVMLTCVFTGNADKAYAMLDQIWPRESIVKQGVIERFQDVIRRSPALDVLVELGHPPLKKH